jgi:hypothetical protein
MNNRSMKNVYILFALLLLSCSCHKDKATAGGDGGIAKEGYATGHIQDTKGQPIKGATVVVNNSLIGNNNPAGVTDEQGNYKIQLPIVGTYHTSATIQRTLNGKTYELELRPDSEEEFSNQGAVRNFEWHLTGKKEHEEEGYYGATIGINTATASEIIDNSKIAFTLVPQGKLIDGSEGTTLVRSGGLPYTIDYGALKDIPLGRYLLTATYKSGSSTVPVKLRKLFAYDDPYTPSLIVDFEPSTLAGKNMVEVSCMEK